MEVYRSGHNGPHSKCGNGVTRSWVRIPSSPPQENCTHPNDKKFRCVYFFSHEYFGIILKRWINSQYLTKKWIHATHCRANRIARLFYCYLLLLHIFAFRLGRCSTVKIGSKRDKLLLKTLIIPRVGLNKKFGSFFIYATISPLSLTSGFATLTNSFHLLFPVMPRLCRKAK